jgi:7-keto-8-aminopelargonate synthetase-like enzyme
VFRSRAILCRPVSDSHRCEARSSDSRVCDSQALAAAASPPPLGHGDAAAASGVGQRGWEHTALCYERAPPARLVSACDYLGLRGDQRLAEAAVKTVQRVGCGSCSPRGFYGTFPEHVKLEQQVRGCHQRL